MDLLSMVHMGFKDNSGGPVTILESGYSISISSERPNPLTVEGEQVYSNGIFCRGLCI